MLQKEVFEHFKKIFPNYEDQIVQWFPNGRDSVRIRLKDQDDLIFTCVCSGGGIAWSLETIDLYIKRLKGEL